MKEEQGEGSQTERRTQMPGERKRGGEGPWEPRQRSRDGGESRVGAGGWDEQAREAVTGWADGGGRAQAKTRSPIRPHPGSNHQATRGTEMHGDRPAGMD